MHCTEFYIDSNISMSIVKTILLSILGKLLFEYASRREESFLSIMAVDTNNIHTNRFPQKI